jgi:hypothetical protein
MMMSMEADPAVWVPLGTLLMRKGLLSAEQLEILVAEREGSGLRIGELAIAFGWASSGDVAQALAEQLGLPFRDLDDEAQLPRVQELIPRESSIRHRAVPLAIRDGVLEVGFADPTDIAAIERVRRLSPLPISVCVVDATALIAHLAAAAV